MAHAGSSPTEASSKKSQAEISLEPGESSSTTAARHRTRKTKPREKDCTDDPTEHADHDHLIGMPQSWVDCKLVMQEWLLVTFLIFGLSIVTIPLGCLLALVAAFIYFSKGGTEEEYGGKYLAQTIYWIAFIAWLYDMVVFALTMLAWVVLVFGECENYDHNVCRFRNSVGYFVAIQMCMVFLHAVFSFAAYLKMRDCCIDILLDEKEAKERFVDMEKQIFEEFKRKRKESNQLKRQKSEKKKKKRAEKLRQDQHNA